MSNLLPTRLRKKERYSPPVTIQVNHTWGHSTAPFPTGSYTDQWIQWRAVLWSRREWCEDQNHRDTYELIDTGKGYKTLKGTMTTVDRGGPLWIQRSTREHFPCASPGWDSVQGLPQTLGNWSQTQVRGYQMIGGGSFGSGLTSNVGTNIVPTFGTLPSRSLIDMGLWGPKAWNKYKPLNPKVSTSQFVAELRDIPRLILRNYTLAKFFKELGEDYLNIEFGWKPFIRDLQSFFTEWFKIEDRIRQLIRDNGRPVHREGTVMQTEDTSSSTTSGTNSGDILSPGFETAAYVKWFGSVSAIPWSKTVTTSIKQKYWFSGTFRYYLQPIGSLRYQEEIARIIYGVDLTPRLLWELMPWSWLVDWATSFGDSISNLTEINLDNLVAEYAYTMGHYVVETETAWSNGLGTARFVQTDEVKARAQATPFGFGVSLGNLTLRQQAILAALALARS